MRRGLPCALAFLISVSCSPALGATSAKLSAADRAFLLTASQGNRFEIATGEVTAQITRKAQTTPAKKLATMAGKIVADHQKSQQRLAKLAQGLHATITNEPDPVQQFLVSQLASYAASLGSASQGAGGAQTTTPTNTTTTTRGDMGSAGGKKGANGRFAPSRPTSAVTVATLRGFYLGLQAAVHQRAITDFSNAAISTRNPAVRRYACQSLPVLRDHLETVQRAIGSAQPALAMSGAHALAARASAACKAANASG
jgi:hypothetical protein